MKTTTVTVKADVEIVEGRIEVIRIEEYHIETFCGDPNDPESQGYSVRGTKLKEPYWYVQVSFVGEPFVTSWNIGKDRMKELMADAKVKEPSELVGRECLMQEINNSGCYKLWGIAK